MKRKDYNPVAFIEFVTCNKCLNDETDGELWFNSRSLYGREFSNFYPSPFTLDGETWSCVEQYYQCAKFARGTEPYNRIRVQAHPGGMKGLAAHYASEMRKDWNEVRVCVMKRALHAKFAQNAKLLSLYAQVCHMALIHEAKRDMCWGMTKARNGENRLGVLIKTVCDTLLEEKQYENTVSAKKVV